MRSKEYVLEEGEFITEIAAHFEKVKTKSISTCNFKLEVNNFCPYDDWTNTSHLDFLVHRLVKTICVNFFSRQSSYNVPIVFI